MFENIESVIEGAKARAEHLRRIVNEVFKSGVHYGSATGGRGGKPTLLKPGAEEWLSIAGLVADFAPIERIGTHDKEPSLSVTMRCELLRNDKLVAVGFGGANTFETKFRWRKGKIACPDCGKPTVSKNRPEYGPGWSCVKPWGGCGKRWKEDDAFDSKAARQENEDPFDLQNNLLKYAEKRALIDAVLRVSGLSAFFTQDVEDMFEKPEKSEKDDSDDPFATPPPKPKVEPTALASLDDDGKVKVAEPGEPIVGVVSSKVETPKAAIPASTGNLGADIIELAKWIQANGGEDYQKEIQAASAFPGNTGFTLPLKHHSEKWLKSTYDKLKKRASESRLASAAGEASF